MAVVPAMEILTRRPRLGEAVGDVKMGDLDEVAEVAAQCLRVKGYCCVSEGVDPEAVKNANDEVEVLDDDGKLDQPAVLVQEGLLGVDGSAQILELTTDFKDATLAPEGVTLRELDALMLSLGNALGPYQPELGFEFTSRSAGCVHQSGHPGDSESELGDREADKWVSVFTARKLMIIIFLGPDEGTLELSPYDEDAESTQLSTAPGLIVMLRTDLLQCSYSSPSFHTNALSCFFMQDDVLHMYGNKRKVHMTPAAVALEDWINDRLRELKEMEDEEFEEDDEIDDELKGEKPLDIPRHWVLTMNHQWLSMQSVAVIGASARMPTTWESDTFFRSSISGADFAQHVPAARWDHSQIYDAQPDSWQFDPPKTSCKHLSVMDGIELFDNKMFGLSAAEVKSMDPCQRVVLETGYDSLFRAGFKKGTLINSSTCAFIGHAISEWNFADRSADVGVHGATGGAPSITAGRFSFCLGLKGQSLAIDTECASSMTAIYWACESVQKKGTGIIPQMSCAIGISLCLAKSWWPAHSAAGFLCPTGRTMTFDSTASGHIRCEGCGTLTVRLLKETSEDKPDERDNFIGLIAGASSNNSGISAGLSAPNGPALQEMLVDSTRKANITTYDIDAVECHGAANLLFDAVETCSTSRVLRGEYIEETLMATSVKSTVGNSIECAGVASFLRILHAGQWGIITPNIHLGQLNPHVNMNDTPINIPVEQLGYRMGSDFTGATACGFGGTNVHVINHGMINEDLRPPPAAMHEDIRPRLAYWPGGGGDLDADLLPRRGYSIAGTWNDWGAPEEMASEGEGVYGYTVTLGDSRWEQFQIYLDGDINRVLHPSRYKGPKGTRVFGPDSADEAMGSSWLLDGRPSYWNLTDSAEEAHSAEEMPALEAGGGNDGESALAKVSVGGDCGFKGDVYRIRLYITGKWRTVTWQRITARESGRLEGAAPARTAEYYVQAFWRGGALVPMEADPTEPGVYHHPVTLTRAPGRFIIVRNKDMQQVLFPSYEGAHQDAVVCGPDDFPGEGYAWHISGAHGESFRIELDMRDDSKKKVSWRKV